MPNLFGHTCIQHFKKCIATYLQLTRAYILLFTAVFNYALIVSIGQVYTRRKAWYKLDLFLHNYSQPSISCLLLYSS